MKMFKKRGFTLIELLVVIAIIGILASIVLVSFPSATKKAKDSRIISAIAQARTVMTYVNGNDGNYANFTLLLPAEDMPPIVTEVTNNGSTLVIVKKADNSAVCMYAKLNTGTTDYYCADSTGVAGKTSALPATCVPATATCGTVTG